MNDDPVDEEFGDRIREMDSSRENGIALDAIPLGENDNMRAWRVFVEASRVGTTGYITAFDLPSIVIAVERDKIKSFCDARGIPFTEPGGT